MLTGKKETTIFKLRVYIFLTAILSGLSNYFFIQSPIYFFSLRVSFTSGFSTTRHDLLHTLISFIRYLILPVPVYSPFFSFIFSLSFSLLYFRSRSCNGFTPLCSYPFLSFLGSSRHQPTI